jgi:hypothetical protein
MFEFPLPSRGKPYKLPVLILIKNELTPLDASPLRSPLFRKEGKNEPLGEFGGEFFLGEQEGNAK